MLAIATLMLKLAEKGISNQDLDESILCNSCKFFLETACFCYFRNGPEYFIYLKLVHVGYDVIASQ